MPDFTCGVCGKSFAVAEETLAKYPGWSPRFCMQHRNSGRQQQAQQPQQRRGFRSAVAQKVAPAPNTAATAPLGEQAAAPLERGPVVPRRLPPAHAFGSRTFGRGQPEREVLTTEEVLERYTAGPQSGLFTDGGCDPNPGPGGWGVVHVQEGQIVRELCGGDRETTNNRMEMTALIRALEYLPADADVTIYSDSELCVKTLTEWATGWKRAGWSRKGGKPIANLDLVIHAFDALAEHPQVRLQWIKAHDGSRWNEYADALATKGRRTTR